MTDCPDTIQPPHLATEFTVPSVLDALTAAIPDRELVVQGDRRHTYTQILEPSILGSFRARVAPFNVNYPYVRAELAYPLADSAAATRVYLATFAPTLAEVLPELPHLRVLVQIADESGHPLLEGAVDYESIVASGPRGRRW